MQRETPRLPDRRDSEGKGGGHRKDAEVASLRPGRLGKRVLALGRVQPVMFSNTYGGDGGERAMRSAQRQARAA